MALPTIPEDKKWPEPQEDTPWVIINTATIPVFFECTRCDTSEDMPKFPVDMKDFIKAIETFVDAHRGCEEDEDEDERVCETCDGEGTVEGALVCGNVRAGGCRDGLCGGCYPTEPCPDCGENSEPDWDAIAEDRAESRALQSAESNDEVDWESPQ